jgi:hypothetical protein
VNELGMNKRLSILCLLALGCNLEAANYTVSTTGSDAANGSTATPSQQTALPASLPTYQWRYQSSSDLRSWYWMPLPPVVNTFTHCKLKVVGTWNTTLFIRLVRN